MSDIRKLINIISETTAGATASGSVANVAQPMETLRRRSDEDYAAEAADSTPELPQVLEYGNWENSALTTSKKLKKARSKAKKIVKSIYGEDKPEVDETLHGQQKKLDINKSGSLDSEDFALLRSKKKVSESRKLASNLAEGRLKQALWDDAEELSLDDFLEKHAKHNDDTEWLTVFWKKTNGVEDDKQEVTEDSIQSLRKQYNSNEHNNYHSENIVLLAKHFGTPQELAMAQKIARYRDKHGGLSYDDPKVAKYLQFQQMINNKYFPLLFSRRGVAEGSDVEYIVVIRDEQGKRSIRVSALTPTDAKEKAEAQGYKVLKVKDPNEKHYFREQGVAEGSGQEGLEQDKKLLQDIIDFAKQNGYKVTYRSPQKSWEEVRPGPGVSILYFENNNTELAFYAEVVKKSTRIYIRFGSIDGSFLDDIVFTPKEFLKAFTHAHQKLLDPANRDDRDHPLQSFLDLRLGTIDGRPMRNVLPPKPARIKASNKQGVTEGSIKSTQQQLADAQQKLMDIISKANGEPPATEAEAKERQALFNKIKRLRTQVAGSRSEGVKENVAEGYSLGTMSTKMIQRLFVRHNKMTQDGIDRARIILMLANEFRLDPKIVDRILRNYSPNGEKLSRSGPEQDVTEGTSNKNPPESGVYKVHYGRKNSGGYAYYDKEATRWLMADSTPELAKKLADEYLKVRDDRSEASVFISNYQGNQVAWTKAQGATKD
jgi:hypothetical protein